MYDGRLQILRYSDHLVSYDSNNLLKLHKKLEVIKQLSFITASGEFAGQIWVLRPFYKTTLKDSEDAPTIAVFDEIINQLKILHKAGITHGHLCPANVGIDNSDNDAGSLRLIDINFCELCNNSKSLHENLAPEIQAGYPPTVASDVFGFGVILEEAFGSKSQDNVDTNNDFFKFVNTIVCKDPLRRPNLVWIEENYKGNADFNLKSNSKVDIINKRSKKIWETRGWESGKKGSEAQVENDEKKRSQKAVSPKNITLYILITLFFVTLIVGFKFFLNRFSDNNLKEEQIESSTFQSYWESGDRNLMKEVAVAAVVDKDETARYVVNKFAYKGKNENGVLATIIKTALNPIWDNELTEEDLQIVYRIGLGALLPKELHATKIRIKTHPAVVLALVGALDLDSPGTEFANIKVSEMAKLPEPYGKAFGEIERLGISNMESNVAKALSHIAIGNVSNRSLEEFLFGIEMTIGVEERIKIIMPLIIDSDAVQQAVVELLSTKDGVKKDLFEWMKKSDLGLWEKATVSDKLIFASGIVPEKLTFEQRADLLSLDFDPKIKEEVLKYFMSNEEQKDLQLVINMIKQFPGSFTRSQVVSLLSALKLSNQSGYQFLNQWFKTNPNPQIIIQILVNRRKTSEVDGFVFEASRYLSSNTRKIVLKPEELIAFSTHPEPILRALAYSQLDSTIAEHREIMQNAIKIEQNPRLRGDLEERLRDSL